MYAQAHAGPYSEPVSVAPRTIMMFTNFNYLSRNTFQNSISAKLILTNEHQVPTKRIYMQQCAKRKREYIF